MNLNMVKKYAPIMVAGLLVWSVSACCWHGNRDQVEKREQGMAKFALGFSTLDQEGQVDRLPVKGSLPDWLSGTLLRNGPARFEVGGERYRHWFDGLAMLHRFTFKGGNVAYANRYLRSRDYRESMAAGKITYREFATNPNRALIPLLSPRITDNANVNLVKIADHLIAMTETPFRVEFDQQTLETLGDFDYGGDGFPDSFTTAHPQYDFTRHALFNYTIKFSLTSSYHVYSIPEGQVRRQPVGSVPVKEPAYMHSFGMTEHYIILTEFPLVVKPLRLLTSCRPFIENYTWQPERGTRFIVMNKQDGTVKTWTSPAFFAFHHVNAFEQDGDIWVDIAAYPDARIIQALAVDHLRAGDPVPLAELRRYRLSPGAAAAGYVQLSPAAIELPRLNYRLVNTKDYRFVYGIGNRQHRPEDFADQLVKIDVRERKAKTWWQEDCYPGEPVFVAAPQARGEDDGVILSVVLDAGRGNSFLLVLDAATFSELARAEVPHPIPFGFHGEYFEDAGKQ